MLIKNPISLFEITEKLSRFNTAVSAGGSSVPQSVGYQSLDELKADLKLMFDNACTYNLEGSEIYRDSKTLLVFSSSLV
jgi:hypothetical protein